MQQQGTKVSRRDDHEQMEDLNVARRHLQEVAAMALRASLSSDPREVWLALAVLDCARAA